MGLDGPVEFPNGGLLTYPVYAALLTALDADPAFRNESMTRRLPLNRVRNKTYESCKAIALAVVAVSAVLMLTAWLLPVASVAAVFGGQ